MRTLPSTTYTNTCALCRCGSDAPPARYSTATISTSLPADPTRSRVINCLTIASGEALVAAALAAPGQSAAPIQRAAPNQSTTPNRSTTPGQSAIFLIAVLLHMDQDCIA